VREASCFEALRQVEGPCVNLTLNGSEGRRRESGNLNDCLEKYSCP
jgi:hypothetical protein